MESKKLPARASAASGEAGGGGGGGVGGGVVCIDGPHASANLLIACVVQADESCPALRQLE